MKTKLIAVVAASVVVASSLAAAAAPVTVRMGPNTRLVTFTPQVAGEPVLIRNGKTVGSVEALDMDLTPIEGTQYAFTNRAGQVVIMAPKNGRVSFIPK